MVFTVFQGSALWYLTFLPLYDLWPRWCHACWTAAAQKHGKKDHKYIAHPQSEMCKAGKWMLSQSYLSGHWQLSDHKIPSTLLLQNNRIFVKSWGDKQSWLESINLFLVSFVHDETPGWAYCVVESCCKTPQQTWQIKFPYFLCTMRVASGLWPEGE